MVFNSSNYGFSYSDFLSFKGRKYIYGINKYSKYLSELLTVDGYIDDYSKHEEFMGKPIFKLNDLPEDACLVISCVISARPKTALEKLALKKNIRYIDYPAFSETSKGIIRNIDPVVETRADYAINKSKYNWMLDLLADEESKKTINDLIKFRLNADFSCIQEYKFRANDQYFEPFISYGNDEVFVDGGAFDGLTSLEFHKQCNKYKSIYVFEPELNNMNLSKKNLSALKRVHYHLSGLFDDNREISFDSNCGSASKISENGEQIIAVCRLDDVVKEQVTFVKLDIEGAEINALNGMKDHIINDHPKLAIAIYHSPDHFWRTPELILGLRSDYKVYVRHYTESWTETVMYFIPH